MLWGSSIKSCKLQILYTRVSLSIYDHNTTAMQLFQCFRHFQLDRVINAYGFTKNCWPMPEGVVLNVQCFISQNVPCRTPDWIKICYVPVEISSINHLMYKKKCRLVSLETHVYIIETIVCHISWGTQCSSNWLSSCLQGELLKLEEKVPKVLSRWHTKRRMGACTMLLSLFCNDPSNKTTVRKCFKTFQNGWIFVEMLSF